MPGIVPAMRQIKALAVLFALLPGIAAAQPATLPASTVYGRQATPSSGGPGQAIPFSVFFANAGVPAGPVSCSSHNWFNTLSSGGVLGCAQPAIGDISGFGTGVAAALGNNVNSAGGFVTSPVPYANIAAGTSDTVLGYWGSTVVSATAINNCIGALTYSTSTHTFGCNNSAGSGTVTTAGTGLSLTGGGSTLNLALTNTTLQASPSNPAATSSTVGVMKGLGATCHLTPTYSGRIHVEFYGVTTNSTTSQSAINKLYFGTGTAPTDGAATTGTQIGNSQSFTAAVGTANGPLALGGIVTGLTPGTAYWFDLNLAASANSATDSTLSCNAFEF